MPGQSPGWSVCQMHACRVLLCEALCSRLHFAPVLLAAKIDISYASAGATAFTAQLESNGASSGMAFV